MNIVHVYDGHERVYDGRGSVPDVVWNVAKHTESKGHDVTVVERQWGGTDRTAKHEGIRFERLNLRTGSDEPYEQIPYEMVSSPAGAARLLLDRTNFAITARRRLAGLDYDVVHVHLPFAANVLVTLDRNLRDRIVYTAHLGETTKRVVEPLFSPDVYLAGRAARTIVLNPEMRHAFEMRGVPEERLTVIPNGVNVDEFRAVSPETIGRIRETYGIGGGDVVLFVGTITPRKGVMELLQAIGMVTDRHGSAEFVFTGKTDLEPEYFDEVQALIDERGLEDRVTFTGFVPEDDLPGLYELADVFALPSYEEGSSIAVAEAIASGTPIVGSRISGIGQQIDDGVHGRLVEPGDVDELAAALCQLLSDPDRRQRMTDAVDERAMELTWERVVRDIVTVYQEVASA